MAVNLKMSSICCTPEDMEIVRQRFREAVKDTPELFDAAHIDKVENDEWTVKRFIGYKKNNLEEAAAALIKAMKWRKEMDVATIQITEFPSEFFWTGEVSEYVRDKNNCATVYCRVKYHKPLSEFSPIVKRFLLYLMERMDDEIRSGSNGWALIYDCEGGTIFNNNMEILFFMIEVIFEYYPMGVTYVGLYQLPWVMRAIYHVCRGWIPEEFRNKLHFLNPTTIHEYVGTENLPPFLNGTCSRRERKRVPGTMTVKEFVIKSEMKESAISRFYGHYQKYLDMGDKIEEEDRLLQESVAATRSGSIDHTSSNNNKLPVRLTG